MIEFWVKWYKQRQQSCRERETLKKKSERERRTTRDMIDGGKTEIKSYIHIINLAAVAGRSLDICLHQKSCELYKKSVKSFS